MSAFQRTLVLALFLFLPSAHTLLNLIRGTQADARDRAPVTIIIGALIPAVILFLLVVNKILTAIAARRTAPTQRSTSRASAGRMRYGPPLLLLFGAATISMIANDKTFDSALYYVVVFIEGAVSYLVFAGLQITAKFRAQLFTCLALGSLFMLSVGTWAFYKEFGFPDAETLLFARFDAERFGAYQDMTFGNVNQTASFLILVYPTFLVLLLMGNLRRYQVALYALVTVMILVNAAICQVRAAYLVLVLLSAVVVAYFRIRQVRQAVAASAAVALVSLVLFAPVLGSLDKFEDRYSAVVTVKGTESDDSVIGRLDAMKIAWNVFEDHWIVGVGPDQVKRYNPHGTAHQFNIEQAAELGLAGFAGSILLVVYVLADLGRLVRQGARGTADPSIFAYVAGPASHMIYGVIAYATFALGPINTWTILLCAMLGMAEGSAPVSPASEGWVRGESVSSRQTPQVAAA